MINRVDLKQIEILEETLAPAAGIVCGGMCEGGIWCGFGCIKTL